MGLDVENFDWIKEDDFGVEVINPSAKIFYRPKVKIESTGASSPGLS